MGQGSVGSSPGSERSPSAISAIIPTQPRPRSIKTSIDAVSPQASAVLVASLMFPSCKGGPKAPSASKPTTTQPRSTNAEKISVPASVDSLAVVAVGWLEKIIDISPLPVVL